jgi:hypothetical protein
MRNLLSYAGIAVVILALTGCFQVETVIKVNRDGSGTVEESILMSKKALAQLTGLMQEFAGQDGKKPKEKPPVFDLYDPPSSRHGRRAWGKGYRTFPAGGLRKRNSRDIGPCMRSRISTGLS